MAQIAKELRNVETCSKQWWFTVWQPENIMVEEKPVPFEKVCTEHLMNNQTCWTSKPNETLRNSRCLLQ